MLVAGLCVAAADIAVVVLRLSMVVHMLHLPWLCHGSVSFGK